MLRPAARALLFAVTLLGVWLSAAPAWAYVSLAAPLCDQREAITFAPAPTLQDPQLSLGDRPEDGSCQGAAFEARHCEQGRTASFRAAAGDGAAVTLPAGVELPLPWPRELVQPAEVSARGSPGVRRALWRPPCR